MPPIFKPVLPACAQIVDSAQISHQGPAFWSLLACQVADRRRVLESWYDESAKPPGFEAKGLVLITGEQLSVVERLVIKQLWLVGCSGRRWDGKGCLMHEMVPVPMYCIVLVYVGTGICPVAE